jgi:hypothetical protein
MSRESNLLYLRMYSLGDATEAIVLDSGTSPTDTIVQKASRNITVSIMSQGYSKIFG